MGQDREAANAPHGGDDGMARCPRCRHTTPIPADQPAEGLLCPQCGSRLDANPSPAADAGQPPSQPGASNATPPLPPPPLPPQPDNTSRIIQDTVAGFNFRLSDNLFQLAFILVTAGIATLVLRFTVQFENQTDPWTWSLMGGAIAGLVVGGIVSGIVLMIYRAFKH